MRTSSRKTTAAVLRSIIGIKNQDMAERCGCSVDTIRSVEIGRLKLSEKLATKMFHETGISPEWLLNGDPSAPPISRSGDPYTRAKFDQAQASKLKNHYDQPTPWSRNLDAFGFCTRIIAILESAATRKNYHMALYKVHTALGSLQRELGVDEELYRYSYSGPNSIIGANISVGLPLLKEVVATVQQVQDKMTEASNPRKKQPSSRRRSRRV
jgi:transcriptional regulator with XRE-family HTH domain